MKQYSVYLTTETEKYDVIRAIRAAGCRLTNVSGCGAGYLVSIEATSDGLEMLHRVWYSPEIHDMTAAQAWAAWQDQRLTMGQLATWQQRHGLRFSPAGEVTPA